MTIDTITRPLRLAHAHQHHEPANGYAARLAVVNGRRMNVFLKEMGIHPRSIDKGEQDAVSKLARLGGTDPAELLACTPYPAERDRYHVVAGETLGYRAVNRTFFRFCPLCVKEDLETFPGPLAGRPWLRLPWTVSHFRSCDRHNVLFSVTTPIRRRFEPFDFSETMETYLDTIDELVADAVAVQPSPFQAWLTSRLEGQQDPDLWLDQFPVYVAAEWCEGLGVSALHPPKVRTSEFTALDWARAADEGFSISSRGVDGIQELLARLNEAQAETHGFWGARDTYGYAYGLLQKTVEDPAYAPIRELVRDFAIETMPIEPGTDVLGTVVDEPKVLTVQTAARMSGASAQTIRKLFERENISQDALDRGLRNHRVTTTSAEAAEMVRKLKDAFTAPSLAKHLGIPKVHLNTLIAVGALKTVTGSEKHANAKHRFARSDVDDMIARLFDGAEEVEVPTPRQMPIMEARHYAVTSLDVIFSLVFGGKLEWKGRLKGRWDYGAALVDVDEIIRRVRTEERGTGVSKADLVDHIPGLHRRAAKVFLDWGYIKTEMQFSPDARRDVPVIPLSEIERFRKRYVTLGELCTTTGKHFKQVRSLLRKGGVETAFDQKIFDAFVYEREAAEAVFA